MNEAVEKILTSHDYKAIGTDHYARNDDSLSVAQDKGELRRNFQGYTTDISEAIIGFGQSSISSFKTAYVQNTIDPVTYRNTINNSKFPVQRGVKLSQTDQTISKLIEKIMCDFKVNLEEYNNIEINPYLKELEQDGMIIMNGKHLKVTNKGKPFTRIIASCFDPYFKRQENQHAKAI